MSQVTVIEYQTVISVGGANLLCVESYDSLFERLREGAIRMQPDEDGSSLAGMTWFPPIEVTVQSSGKPIRALLSVQAISAIYEIPPEDREPVELEASGQGEDQEDQ